MLWEYDHNPDYRINVCRALNIDTDEERVQKLIAKQVKAAR